MSSNPSTAPASVYESQPVIPEWLASFDGQRVVNIESYKRNGESKRTPVIFVQKDGKLYFQTALKSWKAKRMIRNPRVRLAPSTFNGEVKSAWTAATVQKVEGREASGAKWAYVRRFSGNQPRLPPGRENAVGKDTVLRHQLGTRLCGTRGDVTKMKVATLFRLTSIAVLFQIILGGLVTFSFIPPVVHIVMGSVVLILAIATVVVVFRWRPVIRRLRQIGVNMTIAILVQIILGYSILALGSDVLAEVHLVLGVLIFAMSIAGDFVSRETNALGVAMRGTT